jgi:2-polyprenyl-3-methyl-5-hydroxy-6-metoxy-1,4-benzoquinol methylase
MTSQAIDVPDLDNEVVTPLSADRAPAFDPAGAEAFAARVVGVLNDASLALMISIGHQVELFDAMATLPASNSVQIAAAAGLQERYVREWLAAMTAGGVVTYDPASNTYRLPAEHAACLTRDSGPDNLGHLMQFIPLLASVEEPIVTCFRNGGGVPYSAYRRFHQLMAEDSATVHDTALIDGIIPLVPGLPDQLRSGIEVADLGCGQGHAINLLATAFPNSRFTGYDFSAEAIEAACREAEQLGLSNVAFELQDVTDLGLREAYDLITAFDAIHDQAHPARVLAGIAAALRPDGVFLMVDIQASSRLEENLELPLATFLYTASTLHCMTVSLALNGVGLGTMWGEQLAQAMVREAGFGEVSVQKLESDPFNNYYVATKREGGSTS